MFLSKTLVLDSDSLYIKRALLFDSPVWTRRRSDRVYYIPSDDLRLLSPFSAFLLFSYLLSLRLYSLNRILLHLLSR